MKITRERFHIRKDKLRSIAYIKASPLEHIILWQMFNTRRHNLRPSRNWPMLRKHGASFVMLRKGVRNQDAGRKPYKPGRIVGPLVSPQFSVLELISAGTLWPAFEAHWIYGVATSLVFMLNLMFVVARMQTERQAQLELAKSLGTPRVHVVKKGECDEKNATDL